ncbi:MAG: flagellar basal body rod protein FlgB [Oscillospiraceae bacterium]
MKLYGSYSYNALEKGLDYLWEKQKVIQQNVANYETPNYKSKSISFSDALQGATNTTTEENETRYKIKMQNTDNLTVRPDGNNVNLEKENIELWESYAQYSYLTQKISSQFKNMRYVITQSFK